LFDERLKRIKSEQAILSLKNVSLDGYKKGFSNAPKPFSMYNSIVDYQFF